jgi:hypothetical protein
MMKNGQLAFPTKRSSELKAGIPKSKLCPHLHKLLRMIHASKVKRLGQKLQSISLPCSMGYGSVAVSMPVCDNHLCTLFNPLSSH